ncbi:hypothetical protein CPLU01_09821 [Colletotrichum plurivorum]|uniref:Uncharacterized protein n=1 Tax=Colletotrichum plurivorum TaxID=2175906 RepID=A0A8H6NAZ6_9PEZI|nr:hypothetical protein CPLU01_09821 [Colletotrichum plurivorum]
MELFQKKKESPRTSAGPSGAAMWVPTASSRKRRESAEVEKRPFVRGFAAREMTFCSDKVTGAVIGSSGR